MKWLKERRKKAKVFLLAMCMAVMSSFAAFAAEVTPITSTDWAPIIEAITPQISVSTIVGVLATGVAAVIGLVFMWWGARKAVRMLMAAFRKGKVSV